MLMMMMMREGGRLGAGRNSCVYVCMEVPGCPWSPPAGWLPSSPFPSATLEEVAPGWQGLGVTMSPHHPPWLGGGPGCDCPTHTVWVGNSWMHSVILGWPCRMCPLWSGVHPSAAGWVLGWVPGGAAAVGAPGLAPAQ